VQPIENHYTDHERNQRHRSAAATSKGPGMVENVTNHIVKTN